MGFVQSFQTKNHEKIILVRSKWHGPYQGEIEEGENSPEALATRIDWRIRIYSWNWSS